MMHPMQNRVDARAEEARPLRCIGTQVEEALPAPRHVELLVRAVAVQEERLEEHGEDPVREEEADDHHPRTLRPRTRGARQDSLTFRHAFVRLPCDASSPVTKTSRDRRA